MARRVRREAPGTAALTPVAPHAVEVRQLGKCYGEAAGEVDALRDIDLTVGPGEFVALMGPSGSGKSTLLHLVGAIDSPSSGRVIVEGRDLASFSAREAADYRNHQVGFVFQMLNLVPALTVDENLWLPAAIAGKPRSWVAGRIDELLAEVGLADKRARFPQELSGGEQQRVAVARGVLLRPAVLLADEPTGSLDAEGTQRVMDLLLRLNRQGQVILLATHDPRVASLADRVIYLRDGQIEQELSLAADDRSLPDDLDRVVAARGAGPVSTSTEP